MPLSKPRPAPKDKSKPSTHPLTAAAKHVYHELPLKLGIRKRLPLMALPVEIRFQIYEELLISRWDHAHAPEICPPWAVGHQKEIELWSDLGLLYPTRHRTMTPAVLQTCRQIYREANWILYSKNEFWVWEPKELLRFVKQIGDANSRSIKRLHIRVDFDPWHPRDLALGTRDEWLLSLEVLAKDIGESRQIKCYWDADASWKSRVEPLEGRLPRPAAQGDSSGHSLKFVRALAKFEQLDELVISGYYAKYWPSYLERGIDLWVRAVCGWHFTRCETRQGHIHGEKEPKDKHKLKV